MLICLVCITLPSIALLYTISKDKRDGVNGW